MGVVLRIEDRKHPHKRDRKILPSLISSFWINQSKHKLAEYSLVEIISWLFLVFMFNEKLNVKIVLF